MNYDPSNAEASVSIPLSAAPVALPPSAPVAPVADSVGVLHLINGEHYAGAERVQDLLAKCLPEFGYRVGFACVKPDVFAATRQSQGAPLWDVPMRTKFDLRAAAGVARLIRRHEFRILHAHTVRTALVGRIAAAITGVPLVYHAHSPTSHDSTRRWRDAVNGVIERLSLRGVSRVIAVSQAMAEEIGRRYDRRRIAVVPNGVPSPAAVPAREKPRPPWTLGMVALFRPRKGTEVLLEAMALLRDRGVPVRLRAVGTFESPAYEREIAARLRRLRLEDRVQWTGFTRDVAAELSKMDLLVLPSLFGEGLPMVVLEAMAAGVPVVATRVAGTAEAVRHGRDGLVVEPGDPGQLAAAVADMVEGRQDWAAMRQSAVRRQAACFSDHVMAEGVAAVYNEVLEHRSV
jgi:glycosyltransferase involved in cell wall biosynthesis